MPQNDLPFELIASIFSKLQVRTLKRFKSLSKAYCSLIEDPIFINSHLKQSLETSCYLRLVLVYTRGYDANFTKPEETPVYFSELNSINNCSFKKIICPLRGISREGNVRCWFSLLGGFRGSMDRVPSHLIVAFDLGTQEFHEVSLPDELSSLGGVNVLDLSVLGRDLCVAHYDKNRCLDLWTMKDRKVKASWSKLLSIIVEKGLWCPRPLAYSKYGDKILMEDEMNTLFWYDLVKEEVEKVDNIPNGMHVFSTEICVESLVELEAYRGIRGRKIGL
ncbi:S haplotype-specific F-box protein 1 [Tripterygium wilfordii]|uniref:S haplotype-specific F-box protein 1 n=1 Tax=Tripterygium wilfordii TaxID=458696 RepID=A0A7J7C4T8_TRIWF|nr:S haplotype-specific F-box protein 1 [Tripterygium wilfordii]